MAERSFSDANNPVFVCSLDAIMLPFGRNSYLPVIVERCRGERVALDETTDPSVAPAYIVE